MASDSESDGSRPAALLEADPIVSGKRERKQAAPELTYEVKQAQSLATNAGQGQTLRDSVRIMDALEPFGSKDPVIKLMHRLFYESEGKQARRKTNLRDFSGYPAVTDALKEKKLRMLSKATTAQLKAMCKTLQQPTAGTKEEICQRLVDFACKPSFDATKKSLKKKSKPASKASSKAKTTAKRTKTSARPANAKGVSAFELFFQDAKLAHEAKDPSISAVKLAVACRKEFAALSEDDRQVYEDMAKEKNDSNATAMDDHEDVLDEDGDNDDNNDDDDDYEEKPKPEKKRAKKTVKPKAKDSPKKTSTSKVKSSELALSDSDNDNEDEAEVTGKKDQPPVSDKSDPTEEDVTRAVRDFLTTQDLSDLTKKKVRVAVAKLFPNADLSNYKELIGDTTMAFVQEHTTKEDGEE
eukprot:TRINITY_DN11416_c0_g1_i3.p1 TRINITY_DN11416_c0_g1~~TRINITY_DN11416_c0_g1_i3.p1  ORF type:complete len:419 (+),score=139.85 TRINITY_DN11416_c0_g1_i3:26-1258(+)